MPKGKWAQVKICKRALEKRQKNNHEKWKWIKEVKQVKEKGGWVGTKTKIQHVCIIELQKLSSMNRKNI